MNAISLPKIRMSDAAAAIGLETKALRNWLLNNDISIVENRISERGWRAFSVSDVALLAVMRELVRWGLTVEEANDFTGGALLQILQTLANYKSIEPQHIEATMINRRLYISHNGEEAVMHTACEPSDRLRLPNARSVIALDLHFIISSAFRTLADDGYIDNREAK